MVPLNVILKLSLNKEFHHQNAWLIRPNMALSPKGRNKWLRIVGMHCVMSLSSHNSSHQRHYSNKQWKSFSIFLQTLQMQQILIFIGWLSRTRDHCYYKIVFQTSVINYGHKMILVNSVYFFWSKTVNKC